MRRKPLFFCIQRPSERLEAVSRRYQVRLTMRLSVGAQSPPTRGGVPFRGPAENTFTISGARHTLLGTGSGILPGRRRQRFPSCAPGGGRRGSDAVRGLMRHQPWGLNTSSRVWASRIRSAQDSELGLARLTQALLGPRWQGPEAAGQLAAQHVGLALLQPLPAAPGCFHSSVQVFTRSANMACISCNSMTLGMSAPGTRAGR